MPWTVAAVAAGGLLVFWLPWQVPVRGDIESDSAVFGFSNGAATAGLGLTLLVLMAIRLATPGAAGLLAGLVRPPDRATVAERLALALGIAATAVVTGGWWRLLPWAFFGESTYFLTRLDLLEYGLRPFLDFDFGYGPALLLVPAALHWGSGRMLAMDSAYVLTVVVQTAFGLVAMSAILRRIAGDAVLRRSIFAFVLISSINIALGAIYTPLRFVYAAWAALVFHEAQRWPRPWVGWAAAFLLPFDGFQISPEVGVATTAALLAGLGFHAARGRPNLLPRAAAVVAAPAVFLALFGRESLGMLFAFGSGALNFPILPAPFIIALLGLACFLIPALGAAAIRGTALREADESAPATASLAVALVMMLPAALGRCDPGHVLFNGLPLVAVALAAAGTRCGRGTRRLVAAAAAVILLTSFVSGYVSGGAIVRSALEARRFFDREAAALTAADAAVVASVRRVGSPPDFGWSKRPPFDPGLLPLARYDAVAAPLGAAEDVDRFLKLTGRYVPVRTVPPFAGIGDRASAARMAAAAMRCPHILLPEMPPPPDAAEFAVRRSLYMSVLFALPVAVILRPVREPFSGQAEVQRLIRAEYEPVERILSFEILRRGRAGPAAAGP